MTEKEKGIAWKENVMIIVDVIIVTEEIVVNVVHEARKFVIALEAGVENVKNANEEDQSTYDTYI